MRRLVLLAGLVAALVGCTDSTSPSDPTSGRWRGIANEGDLDEVTLDFTIARDGSTISGAGLLAFIDGSTAFTVSGTWVAPDISLVLSSAGFQDTHFGGTVGAGVMEGFLNGSGFFNLEIVLSRD